ncbi:DUF296 domain-containing protein [Gordonia sp. i37]|uniref:PCC domain-containing protein n=1 Tax=Gordonia sp. i37 TaxID=1961707 RepID=UPI0009AED249|nr:DUF296 domain-containing protein [Gordonia sp. i37]OPX06392.1 hypothetical protein B1964_28670 [Gordonia sp. i37]
MSTTTAITLPPVQHLRQPGTPAAQRIDAFPTTLHHIQVELAVGVPLLTALREIVLDQGFGSAFGEIRGGSLTAFEYFIPALCTTGTSVAAFSDPFVARGPVSFIRGGITIGRRDDAPWTHCHAQFVDADGVMRAGHLLPESVVVGPGVMLDIYASRDVTMTALPDEEINFSVFQPHSDHDHTAPIPNPVDTDDSRAIVARVHANVDLVEAIEDICAAHGFTSAVIRGKIGSLVGATLLQGDNLVCAPGPAVEVMYLDGSVRRDPDGVVQADLTCAVTAIDGMVYTGSLIKGHNPVALTFELALTEPTEVRP